METCVCRCLLNLSIKAPPTTTLIEPFLPQSISVISRVQRAYKTYTKTNSVSSTNIRNIFLVFGIQFITCCPKSDRKDTNYFVYSLKSHKIMITYLKQFYVLLQFIFRSLYQDSVVSSYDINTSPKTTQ